MLSIGFSIQPKNVTVPITLGDFGRMGEYYKIFEVRLCFQNQRMEISPTVCGKSTLGLS